MSLKRVYVILLFLRFDNLSDCEERKKTYPTAEITWVFEEFVKNCRAGYCIGEYAYVDEMRLGFRGRCSMKVYIPSKHLKYGIKIMTLIIDAKTHYFLNGYVYSGKDCDRRTLTDADNKLGKPTQSVLHLSTPIQKMNRNITADN
ncbi:hypothetical protein PR048_013421 [Dryococelus australis]|uniref:PiggyBac transposable element-derived protein domain-containing protein n=1 Tax=Dryococelus australis TaxID=614101 RepID=A0ABQ9HS49_9NEOP|nr:hypothetical protein PR048_013421 [Dryococelus australis]